MGPGVGVTGPGHFKTIFGIMVVQPGVTRWGVRAMGGAQAAREPVAQKTKAGRQEQEIGARRGGQTRRLTGLMWRT